MRQSRRCCPGSFCQPGRQERHEHERIKPLGRAGITPTKDMAWYNALGQGMGETLLTSNEKGAYTLADRGTYLSMKDKLSNLIVVVGGNSIQDNKDKNLLNPYGVLAVDPGKHPGVNFDMATKFVQWITSLDTQKMIGSFGADKFGQPLFLRRF